MAVTEMRLVLVTGAVGGIGQAIVQRLISDQWRVAAIDINEHALTHQRNLNPDRLVVGKCDVTDANAVQAVVARFERELGPIHALVNTVGWVGATRFIDETPEYWRKLISINFEGTLYVTSSVIKTMVAKKSGAIVNIASDAGRVGTSGEAVYSGLKAAIIGFSKSIAREYARYGIRVNCVSPGPTETALLRSYREQQPDLYDRMVKQIPLRRPALPEEIAASVSFLLSNDASYITGQTLSVSGGLTMI